MNYYTAGSLVTVSAVFVDEAANAPIDPTVVTLEVGIYGVTPTTYTYGVGSVIVKNSVGNYHAEIDTTGFTPAGIWYYQWDGTGACQAIAAGSMQIVLPPL